MTGRLVEVVRGFNPEQLAGLGEIGWTFSMDVRPASIRQLYEDEATRPLFDYVTEIEQIIGAIPVARQVAVNLNLLTLHLRERLSFNDLRTVVDETGQNLKKRPLRSGTLEGVDFGIDRASVLVQLDFAHQRRFNGRGLFYNFISGAMETFVDLEHRLYGAGVGRWDPGHLLLVSAWSLDERVSFPSVVLVATPSGNR